MVENKKRRKYIIPALHSHTNSQADQTNALFQAWQRVCLSHRTTPMTDKPTEEKEHRSDDSHFAKAGVTCFFDREMLNSCFLHLMKFSAENPHLRQAAGLHKQLNTKKHASDFRLQHPASSGNDFRFCLSYS
jgi:hypothetical protein